MVVDLVQRVSTSSYCSYEMSKNDHFNGNGEHSPNNPPVFRLHSTPKTDLLVTGTKTDREALHRLAGIGFTHDTAWFFPVNDLFIMFLEEEPKDE